VCDKEAPARRRKSSLSGERDDKIASHTALGMGFTVWTTVWMAPNSLKKKNWRREWDSNPR